MTDPFSYGFDAGSRLQTVTDGADYSATYTYLANSPLVSQVSFANSYMTVMTTAKQYDYVNRLTQISLSPSFEGPLRKGSVTTIDTHAAAVIGCRSCRANCESSTPAPSTMS